MLKIKEVKAKLEIGLQDYFANEGFKYKKSTNEYLKKIQGYEYCIHMPLTSFSNSIFLEVFLYLKNDEVEKVLLNVLGTRDNFTIGNEIGMLFNSINGKDFKPGSLNFFLVDEVALLDAIEMIKNYYENIMVLYFKKYSDLVTLENLFNNEPFDYNPVDLGGHVDMRCIKGLILAQLVGKNIFDKLIEVYDELILKTPEESRDNYEVVKEFLKYNYI